MDCCSSLLAEHFAEAKFSSFRGWRRRSDGRRKDHQRDFASCRVPSAESFCQSACSTNPLTLRLCSPKTKNGRQKFVSYVPASDEHELDPPFRVPWDFVLYSSTRALESRETRDDTRIIKPKHVISAALPMSNWGLLPLGGKQRHCFCNDFSQVWRQLR